MNADVYAPRSVKRGRSTKAELAALDRGLVLAIEETGPPVTVRQVYYLAVARGLVTKDDRGYRKVIRRMSAMRDAEAIPWHWVADNTRWVRRPEVHGSLSEALEDWHESYRRDYWRDQSIRVEVWVESDSIASFVHGITNEFGVPLFTCRGQASRTYVHAAAQSAERTGKPVEIIYIGDFDPTGLQIDVSLEERYVATVGISLRRIAVTADQIHDYGLVGTSAKVKDPNYRRFVAMCQKHGLPVLSVETEALPPAVLRDGLRGAIEDRIDWERWGVLEAVEEEERAVLLSLRDDIDVAVEDGWVL